MQLSYGRPTKMSDRLNSPTRSSVAPIQSHRMGVEYIFPVQRILKGQSYQAGQYESCYRHGQNLTRNSNVDASESHRAPGARCKSLPRTPNLKNLGCQIRGLTALP